MDIGNFTGHVWLDCAGGQVPDDVIKFETNTENPDEPQVGTLSVLL